MKVLIWGTGNTAKAVVERGVNGELVGFIQSEMHGERQLFLYGLPVYTPETICTDYDMIFVASIYSNEIYQTICATGILLEKVCFLHLPDKSGIDMKENHEKASQFLSPNNLLFIPEEKRGSSISDDGCYPAFCLKASKEDDLFNHFRSHPLYKVILEHVSYQLGKHYLDIICRNPQKNFTNQDWEEFSRNDMYGGAETYLFEINKHPLMISPSTLRYIKIMQDIFALFDKSAIRSIAEIGVGYGGQCRLLTSQINNLEQYILIDLPEVLSLAKRYLYHFGNNAKLKFIDGTANIELTEHYDLAISNYAFSELTRNVQDIYLDKILSKAKSGYIIWNAQAVNNLDGYQKEEIVEKLPGKVEIIPEEPLTAIDNCLIIWK